MQERPAAMRLPHASQIDGDLRLERMIRLAEIMLQQHVFRRDRGIGFELEDPVTVPALLAYERAGRPFYAGIKTRGSKLASALPGNPFRTTHQLFLIPCPSSFQGEARRMGGSTVSEPHLPCWRSFGRERHVEVGTTGFRKIMRRQTMYSTRRFASSPPARLGSSLMRDRPRRRAVVATGDQPSRTMQRLPLSALLRRRGM